MNNTTTTKAVPAAANRKFTKIKDLSQFRYGSGEITSAYALPDGCAVAYCAETKEWLKYSQSRELYHCSFGRTRDEAAILPIRSDADWCKVPGAPNGTIDDVIKALKLVLALNSQDSMACVPKFGGGVYVVDLDPKAKEQILRAARAAEDVKRDLKWADESRRRWMKATELLETRLNKVVAVAQGI